MKKEKPYYEVNPHGHVWIKEEGKINTEFGEDCHTGPKCKICGYHFCLMCHDDRPELSCPGVDLRIKVYVDEKPCPKCGEGIPDYMKVKKCFYCGYLPK